MLIQYVGNLDYLMLPLIPLPLLSDPKGSRMQGRGGLSNKTNKYTFLATQLVHFLYIARFGRDYSSATRAPLLLETLTSYLHENRVSNC